MATMTVVLTTSVAPFEGSVTDVVLRSQAVTGPTGPQGPTGERIPAIPTLTVGGITYLGVGHAGPSTTSAGQAVVTDTAYYNVTRFDSAVSVDLLAVETTVAGLPAGTVYGAILADDNGTPGEVLATGTIPIAAGAATGVKSVAITPIVLPAGRYWTAVVADYAFTLRPFSEGTMLGFVSPTAAAAATQVRHLTAPMTAGTFTTTVPAPTGVVLGTPNGRFLLMRYVTP